MSKRRTTRLKAWLASVAVALALAFTAARCGEDVELGVDPESDAGSNADASADR